jgi:tetratricopeptide (TPR) repeat protein
MYQEMLEKNPNDLKAVNGLIQVYSRWGRWQEALNWTLQRARLQPRDTEAQYAVGVLIYNLLADKGGSGDNATFDPRPSAKPDQPSPVFRADDLVGGERSRLADTGIVHLKGALELRPKFSEAMTYLNLLHRQKALAFFNQPELWQKQIDRAESWRSKAIATRPPATENR